MDSIFPCGAFFRVDRIFTLEIAKGNDIGNLEPGAIPFIGRSSSDNGLQGYVANAKETPGQCITLGMVGTFEPFWQPYESFAASQNILCLRSTHLNQYIALFLCTIIRQLVQIKYTYGRSIRLKDFGDELLNLPIQLDSDGEPITDPDCIYSDEGYVPDWTWMENYIRGLGCKQVSTGNTGDAVPELDIDTWKEFYVARVFDCATTTAILPDDIIEGEFPYVTRSATDNGVSGYVGNTDYLVPGNCITIGAEGLYAFYQKDDFVPGIKIYTLRNECLNPYIAMFMVPILNAHCFKYSYGRARILSKIKTEIIKLPIKHNPDGTPVLDPSRRYSSDGYVPDFAFMENYIRSLPYGDRI